MGYLKKFQKSSAKRGRSSSKGKPVKYFFLLADELNAEIENFSSAMAAMKSENPTTLMLPIFDNFLFFRIVFKDILTLVNQLQSAKTASDRNLISRSLAQHLYEFIDDCKDFLGPKQKGGLAGFEKLKDFDRLQKELYRVKEILKAVKDRSFKDLGEVRHNTSAHKTQDSILLYNLIKKIDSNDILANAMVCSLLFCCIVQFQNNVFRSIISPFNSEQFTNSLFPKPSRTVDQTLGFFSMVLNGVAPILASELSLLNEEELRKFREVSEYLKTMKSAGSSISPQN